MPLQYVSAIASAIESLTKTKQLQQEGLVKAWWFRSLAITLVIQLQFDIKLRASPNQIRIKLTTLIKIFFQLLTLSCLIGTVVKLY